MDKELQKLINEHMPKRYYGHEARRCAGVIAKLYAKQQVKNLSLSVVNNNEVTVCDENIETFEMCKCCKTIHDSDMCCYD